MRYIKKTWQLIDNYILARWQKRPSTALFWYLPEPPNIKTPKDLIQYQENTVSSPIYLLNYREKLSYPLKNDHGIIVLPYGGDIGLQVNPEAAFQYTLGIHDEFYLTKNPKYLTTFWQYVNYFFQSQTTDGLWAYDFDWYGSKAPWYSALAQGRGASVMLRAWLISKDDRYLNAAKKALTKFSLPTKDGGFLHICPLSQSPYFEEYPNTPTGVINGFMASLLSIWEMKHWTQDPLFKKLWALGIQSLEKMLPYYSTGWWSLYDHDKSIPIINVNSPRYHLLEIHYLQILSLLSKSPSLIAEYKNRKQQYRRPWLKLRAMSIKTVRKILYK